MFERSYLTNSHIVTHQQSPQDLESAHLDANSLVVEPDTGGRAQVGNRLADTSWFNCHAESHVDYPHMCSVCVYESSRVNVAFLVGG